MMAAKGGDFVDFIIGASDLFQKAKEMLNDGMDYVVISLMEPDNTVPDLPLPASVHFDAFKAHMPEAWIDYEDIDVVSGAE